MRLKSKVLIIAGSDSSGGAGIQADIKTVTSLGSYAMTAITAVTAQNTTGVKSIIPIRPKDISNQIEYSAKDIRPHAIKIGMLHSKKVIEAVIKSLKKINIKKIVLDPVMVAKGGTKLINNEVISSHTPSRFSSTVLAGCELSTFNVERLYSMFCSTHDAIVTIVSKRSVCPCAKDDARMRMSWLVQSIVSVTWRYCAKLFSVISSSVVGLTILLYLSNTIISPFLYISSFEQYTSLLNLIIV